VTNNAVWVVNNKNIATINNGQITAGDPGDTEIFIRSYGLEKLIKVTVDNPEPQPEGLTVNPGNINLEPDETRQLEAILILSDNSTQDVTQQANWSVENTSIASVNKGKVTAKGPGTTKVTVTCEGQTAKAYIEVIETAPEPEKIDVAPSSVTITPGEKQSFEAVLVFSDGSTEDVTHNAVTGDSQIATVNNGTITAHSPGSTDIVIESQGKTATIQVNVNEEQPQVTGLKVTPDKLTLKPGETKQLMALLEYSNGGRDDVTKDAVWSVNNSNIATVTEGKVIANTSGTTEILVKSNNETATVVVTVEKEDTPPEPEKLILTPDTVTLKTGHEKSFEAMVEFSDGSTRDITHDATFGTTNRSIATVSDGKIIAGQPGNAKILVRGYGFSEILQVEVIKDTPTPEPVELNTFPSMVNLELNEHEQLTAILQYSDGSSEDVTQSADWTSNNSQIASVINGKVVAKSEGITEITVEKSGFSQIVNVEVSEPMQDLEPESLLVSPDNLKLNVDEDRNLTAVLTYTDGTTKTVTNSTVWSTSNPEIVSVDNGTVIGNSTGTAQVTATFEGISTTVQVNVQDAQEVKTLPAVTFPGEAKSKQFQWTYNGTNYKWHVEAPQYLYDYSKEIQGLTKQYYESDPYTQQQILQSLTPELRAIVLACSMGANGDRRPWVKESNNVQYIKYLANTLNSQAQTEGFTEFETAEFALSFVQSIPYEAVQYPQLPTQTVFETGDCDGKSILMGALLTEMGYDSALMYYSSQSTGNDAGHMAIGISFAEQVPSRDYPLIYTTYRGKKYYFAETTEERLIGERIGYTLTEMYSLLEY